MMFVDGILGSPAALLSAGAIAASSIWLLDKVAGTVVEHHTQRVLHGAELRKPRRSRVSERLAELEELYERRLDALEKIESERDEYASLYRQQVREVERLRRRLFRWKALFSLVVLPSRLWDQLRGRRGQH
jgi:hypothetical protein